MYVYRFKNSKEEIIYIGRAKKLKERMNGHKHLPKECYNEISKVEYITLSNDDESAIYERYLINKHLPKYNIEYKNNSNFIFELPEKEWEVFDYNFSKELKRNYITINKNIKHELTDSELGKLIILLFNCEVDVEGYLCNKKFEKVDKYYISKILQIGIKPTERYLKRIVDIELFRKEGLNFIISDKLLKN